MSVMLAFMLFFYTSYVGERVGAEGAGRQGPPSREYPKESEVSAIITSDFFGVQAIGQTAQQVENMHAAFSAMREMGVGYIVVDPSIWTRMEPDPPSKGVHRYRWDEEDIKYKVAKEYGFKVQAMLQCRSNWATTHREKDADENCCDTFPLKPGHEGDWRAFVKAYVERYYEYGLREITIGNEISSPSHFFVYGGNLKNYGVILSNAYKGAKEANADVAVASGFMNFGAVFDGNPREELIKRGKIYAFVRGLIADYSESFDSLPTQFNDSYVGIEPMHRMLDGWMLELGVRKPISCEHARSTQFRRKNSPLPPYYPDESPKDGVEDILRILSKPGHPDYNRSKKLFFADQARETVRKLTTALAAGREKIFIALSADPQDCSGRALWPADWQFTGLIETKYYCESRDSIGARKPAYYSYKLFIEKVLGASREVESLNVGKNIHAYRFARDGKSFLVIWHHDLFDTDQKGLIRRNQSRTVDLSSHVQRQQLKITRIVTELDKDREPIYSAEVVVFADSVTIDETPVFAEEVQ